MTPSTDARVGALVAVLKGNGEHRGRRRISFTYLAHLCDIPPRHIGRYLALRPVRDVMSKYRWQLTTSAALGLPPLERPPYAVAFLARD